MKLIEYIIFEAGYTMNIENDICAIALVDVDEYKNIINFKKINVLKKQFSVLENERHKPDYIGDRLHILKYIKSTPLLRKIYNL